jgi:hypothetical protein
MWVGAATVIIEGQQLKRSVVIETFPDLFLTAPAYAAEGRVNSEALRADDRPWLDVSPIRGSAFEKGRILRQRVNVSTLQHANRGVRISRLLHKNPLPISLEQSPLVSKLSCELRHSFLACEARANEHTALSSWDRDPLRS